MARWSRRGSSQLREEAVADPAIIRRLDVGQAAYIYRGGVTYVQVKRLVAAPAALPLAPWAQPRPGGPAPGRGEAAAPAARRAAAALPDITAFLDDAFGPAPAIAARGGTAAGPSARTGTNAAAGAAAGRARPPGRARAPGRLQAGRLARESADDRASSR